jgi:uncharacterized protein YacL (UPF0231 family)
VDGSGREEEAAEGLKKKREGQEEEAGYEWGLFRIEEMEEVVVREEEKDAEGDSTEEVVEMVRERGLSGCASIGGHCWNAMEGDRSGYPKL